MKQKYTVILSLLLLAQLGVGQSKSDRKAVEKIEWQTQQIADGIVLKTAHVRELYGKPQYICMMEIDLNKGLNVGITQPADVSTYTSDQAKQLEAITAINGTFFSIQKHKTFFFLKKDHQVLSKTMRAEFDRRATAALLITNDGSCTITDWDQAKEKAEITDEKYRDALVSGPLLVLKGKNVLDESNTFNDTRNPRSAIAITQTGKLLLIVVDGRHGALAEGMDLHQLAHFMKTIGAVDAMNLDGGGSSSLYVKGFPENGLVNHPSGNNKFDCQGERKVMSIIYVK